MISPRTNIAIDYYNFGNNHYYINVKGKKEKRKKELHFVFSSSFNRLKV